MKKILPFLILTFIFFNLSHSLAQTFDDQMVKLPHGTILTLKEDFIIPTYEGIISVEHNSDNYKVYNLVFDSKNKRRILRKGTEFIVKEIEVGTGKFYIHIEKKINWIYFGEIDSREKLLIGDLRGLFDVEFPGLEEF